MYKMKIIIDDAKKLTQLKNEFNHFFPYLSLEFFESRDTGNRKIHTLDGITVGKCRKSQEPATFTVSPKMSVADLENILKERFGLNVQVLRKSGMVWLKTTHTDAWSIEQQNTQGKIVSAHLLKQEENKRNK
jgi:hypothetical protein